ncbi:hypothetical protein PMW00_03865 [Clostridium paraputrificum]|uniref:hypothetical protein n=1 Tax=Clostridium paraputrificum TaxID=29363 RepID=UPI00232BF57A|nr:hypothetical protein [Clostridium paraputrificum]MDB2102154.1 hypothetical protein [Clostridium paraputrificum]
MEDRSRYLSIPLNKKGIEDLEYGVEESNNIKVIMLGDSEFEELYKENGIFDIINEECNLLIDDFESERIPKEKIQYCLNIVDDKYTKFKEALNLAKEYNTFVDLDF